MLPDQEKPDDTAKSDDQDKPGDESTPKDKNDPADKNDPTDKNDPADKKDPADLTPRPVKPEDESYRELMMRFTTHPVKPKYWFEEFGDHWTCS